MAAVDMKTARESLGCKKMGAYKALGEFSPVPECERKAQQSL